MKPEELRIGNYVTINNNNCYSDLIYIPFKVVGIHKLEKYSIQLYNEEWGEYNQFIEFIQPIRLDTGFLIKSGFKRQVTGIGWDKYSNGLVDLSLAPLSNGSCIPVYHINGEMVKIMYLHQLQNLFYSLSQKELEINL